MRFEMLTLNFIIVSTISTLMVYPNAKNNKFMSLWESIISKKVENINVI